MHGPRVAARLEICGLFPCERRLEPAVFGCDKRLLTMARNHPFHNLFETFGRMPLAHADAVNRRPYEELRDALSAPPHHAGGCIIEVRIDL